MAMNADRPEAGPPPEDPRDPGLSALYRSAALDEPPARLDAALRAAARREVGAGPRPAGSMLRTWRVPMALAAVLVLSVSVVLLMEQEDAGRIAEYQGAPRDQARRAEREQAATPPQAPSPPSEARRAAQAPAPAGRSAPAPSAKPAEADASVGSRQKSTPPSVGAMTRPESSTADRAVAQAGEQAMGQLRSEEGPSERAEVAPAAAPPSREALRRSRLVDALDKEPPEKWLAKIAELRRDGMQAEADELLQAFRRRFPDHPLPDALR